MKKPMRIPSVSLLLIVSFLFLSPFLSFGDSTISSSSTSINEPNNINLQSGPRGNYRPASGPTKTGVLPAIEFLQSGTNTETTGLLSARTDETSSVVSNLTLDTANGWRSDQIELNVSELRKQFVLDIPVRTLNHPGVFHTTHWAGMPTLLTMSLENKR